MAASEAGGAIEIASLSYAYLPGGHETLKEVTLALPAGARCVLVGQNGAGKSTLLQIMSGDKMATPKQVTVCGEDPFRGSSGKKVALVQGGWRSFGDSSTEDRAAFMRVWEMLGIVEPGEEPHIVESGEEPVMLAPTDDSYADRLLEALCLRPLLTRYFGSLSDGERRRVELGRKMQEKRAVVLLDEATTDLDLIARSNLLHFLESEAVTVVNATHVFDGLESWATHLLHMHDGRVVRFEQISHDGEPLWAEGGGLFGLVARWLATTAGVEAPAVVAESETAMEDDSTLVEVKELKFAYAPWCPLSLRLDSLQLPCSCRCVLAGLNGAGKTTLLTVLSGRRMAANSDVKVLGFRAFYEHVKLDPVVGILSSEWKRQISEISSGRMVTFAELTAGLLQELVATGIDMAMLSSRMMRLIQILGIDPTKPLGSLSDGSLRRVQIALKLLRPNKLLLVDEVTADLDVLARAALLAFLREESHTGCSIVYCTHIYDGLDTWATHVLRLRPGGHDGELMSVAAAGFLDGVAHPRLHASASPFVHAIFRMLTEDSKLEPIAAVPATSAAQAASKPSGGELPPGWEKRGATQAGAYGDYAWNADKGSEDTWSFKSVAEKPADPMSAMSAGPGQGGGQQMPGAFAGAGAFQPPGAPAPGGGFAAPGAAPAFGSGYMPQSQPGFGGMPSSAPMRSAGTSGMSTRGCPPEWASRSNQMPMEELLQRGIVQPDKPQPRF